jgi:FixJ family two-component response regulator
MLLDIRMPGLYGVEVMRLASPKPPYPVVAMTGHVDAEAQEEFR